MAFMAVGDGIVIGDTPRVFAGVRLQPVINQMNAIESCVCLSFLSFACAILPRLCSNEWRAHSKLVGSAYAYVSPFYLAVVVGSHHDKLEGTDK
jgi:hypothetical protein